VFPATRFHGLPNDVANMPYQHGEASMYRYDDTLWGAR
jgi:hypothetical protein